MGTYIPEKVRLQVWTDASGRCEFRHCNKHLWKNDLTLNEANFSEMAHIIGASAGGPRGGDDSEALAQDPKNLMLLCRDHHKEIDDSTLRALYPEELLLEMKSEHETRVKMLLDMPSKRTRPIILTSNIGDQNSMCGRRSISRAILPDYPDKSFEDWFAIEIGNFDRSKEFEWSGAMQKIDLKIASLSRAIENADLQHLSVFGLAPQPLLMYLGAKLGDKLATRVYEPRRTSDQDKMWRWDEDSSNRLIFNDEKLHQGTGTDVILLFALSDCLGEDKYANMVAGDPHVYVLKVDNPVQGSIKTEKDKAEFITAARSLLNKIQLEIGKDCLIHILPAMAASLAVEFGRLIQPTKDPNIWVYEYSQETGPIKAVELLNK